MITYDKLSWVITSYHNLSLLLLSYDKFDDLVKKFARIQMFFFVFCTFLYFLWEGRNIHKHRLQRKEMQFFQKKKRNRKTRTNQRNSERKEKHKNTFSLEKKKKWDRKTNTHKKKSYKNWKSFTSLKNKKSRKLQKLKKGMFGKTLPPGHPDLL